MILASLIIGLLTAYYFGLRHGITAALVAFGLFLVEAVVPGLTVPIYVAIGVGVVALLVIGPRRAPSAEAGKVRRVLGAVWGQIKRQLRRRRS
ncbi:hypothetical protein [Haliangium sp.]|uniref:hypothetical protein n=1 Tax=Haliangium sp. TaxID=2663208 RepID=UPI003D09FDFB